MDHRVEPNRRGRRRLWLAVLTMVGVASLGIWSLRMSESAQEEVAEPLRLGVARQVPSALLFIAAEEGFFAQEGLDVTFQYHVSGRVALAALSAGEVDATGAADTPIVTAAFDQPDFVVVATMASLRNEPKIVGRRDRGIEQPADLRGKRVGTQEDSAVHFFLYRFLIRHGLSEDDVELVFLPPEQLPHALSEGRIDAFSLREPFVSQAVEQLGNQVVMFAEDGLYLRPEHLVVSTDLLERKPEAVERLLRALTRAERFAWRNPVRARLIVAQAIGLEPGRLQTQWQSLELDLHMDQSLLSSMEEQARWALRSGLVEPQPIPNYLELLRVEPLRAVKPEAVTVIR